MEKRLKNYLAAMDELLASLEDTCLKGTPDASNTNHQDTTAQNAASPIKDTLHAQTRHADDMLREHLTQIQFFQHERLIHLIVTCLFAVLAFAVFFALFFTMNAGLFVLFAALLVLLVPYIRHYYILENGVQRMYKQYDRLRKLLRG